LPHDALYPVDVDARRALLASLLQVHQHARRLPNAILAATPRRPRSREPTRPPGRDAPTRPIQRLGQARPAPRPCHEGAPGRLRRLQPRRVHRPPEPSLRSRDPRDWRRRLTTRSLAPCTRGREPRPTRPASDSLKHPLRIAAGATDRGSCYAPTRRQLPAANMNRTGFRRDSFLTQRASAGAGSEGTPSRSRWVAGSRVRRASARGRTTPPTWQWRSPAPAWSPSRWRGG